MFDNRMPLATMKFRRPILIGFALVVAGCEVQADRGAVRLSIVGAEWTSEGDYRVEYEVHNDGALSACSLTTVYGEVSPDLPVSYQFFGESLPPDSTFPFGHFGEAFEFQIVRIEPDQVIDGDLLVFQDSFPVNGSDGAILLRTGLRIFYCSNLRAELLERKYESSEVDPETGLPFDFPDSVRTTRVRSRWLQLPLN